MHMAHLAAYVGVHTKALHALMRSSSRLHMIRYSNSSHYGVSPTVLGQTYCQQLTTPQLPASGASEALLGAGAGA